MRLVKRKQIETHKLQIKRSILCWVFNVSKWIQWNSIRSLSLLSNSSKSIIICSCYQIKKFKHFFFLCKQKNKFYAFQTIYFVLKFQQLRSKRSDLCTHLFCFRFPFIMTANIYSSSVNLNGAPYSDDVECFNFCNNFGRLHQLFIQTLAQTFDCSIAFDCIYRFFALFV